MYSLIVSSPRWVSGMDQIDYAHNAVLSILSGYALINRIFWELIQ